MTNLTTCMIKASIALAVVSSTCAAAQDNPNAATEAETARLTAEAAQINAEAALATAKAAREKSIIENLGLPKFDNKSTLTEGGGAIETSLLSTRAIQFAGTFIQSKIGNCSAVQPFIILADDEAFNPNISISAQYQADYLLDRFQSQIPARPAAIGFTGIAAILSTVAGLAGNEVAITGVKTDELDSRMLSQAVANASAGCTYLPSAGISKLGIENSELAKKLTTLFDSRRDAIVWIANLPKKPKPNPADVKKTALLTELIKEANALEQALQKADTNGITYFERAIASEKFAQGNATIVRVSVDRAGGTITNSKNLGTLFGADPVRVSGGLVASWTAMDMNSGKLSSSGTVACQTARVRLREVHSGDWSKGRTEDSGTFCKG